MKIYLLVVAEIALLAALIYYVRVIGRIWAGK